VYAVPWVPLTKKGIVGILIFEIKKSNMDKIASAFRGDLKI